MLLADILIHDDGCGNTDIETFYAAKLGDTQTADIGEVDRVKTYAKSLVAQNKSAFQWQACLVERGVTAGLKHEQGVVLFP